MLATSLRGFSDEISVLRQEVTRKMKDLSDEKNVAEIDKQQVMDEKGELIKNKTKLELDIRDLEEGVNDDVNTRVSQIEDYDIPT